MHALHRPDLHRAIAVTALTAVVAMVLALAVASGLDHLASTPAPAAASGTAAGVQASATLPGPTASPFTRSPFSGRLTASVTQLWTRSNR
jgi:hypothetical protein